MEKGIPPTIVLELAVEIWDTWLVAKRKRAETVQREKEMQEDILAVERANDLRPDPQNSYRDQLSPPINHPPTCSSRDPPTFLH